MIKQFSELKIPFPIHFLEASVPKTTQAYLPVEGDSYENRVLCCARSHIRAIAQAANELSCDFTLIMEDDAALHRDTFEKGVNDIISNWNKYVLSESHMFSIGWTPFKNYSYYAQASSPKSLECIPSSKILEWFAYGTEAYIISKASAKLFTPILLKDKYTELKEAVKSHNCPHIEKDNKIEAADVWLNKLLVQTILFPPLVVEQYGESILTSGVWAEGSIPIWKRYFDGHEALQKEYWSFE